MKTSLTLIICSICLVCCSKKNDPAPTPIVVVPEIKPDTISAGWTKTTFPGEYLTDIYFLNTLEGYTSGNKILKTTNGGSNWTAGASTGGINITGTPNGKVFVVDRNDKIYSSLDNGSSFQSAVLTDPMLYDVYFTDNNNGIIAGQTALFQTTDGGVSWAKINPLSGITFSAGTYRSLFFIDALNGWMALGKTIYHTSSSVNNWSGTTLPSAGSLNSIYATTANIVYCVSSAGEVYKSIDGGTSFSLLTMFDSPGTFADIHFVDSNNGYICYGRKIYKTTDAGASWQTIVSLGQGNIVEVYFKDAAHGWACGDSTILQFRQ